MAKTASRRARAATVRQVTLDLLRRLGIARVFGNPGSTEVPFLNDWPEDIAYILGLNEACVVAMAEGHARATGNAGFVNLHSAAGLGHGLGNVFTAYRNRTPLVIVAGQQARSLLPTQPYLYAEAAQNFPMPYVKWSIEPARAENVPGAIATAYDMAMQRPCGPTFVSVPVDDWGRAASPVQTRIIARDVAPDRRAIESLAKAIDASRRPAFVVGPAVDAEHAVDMMVALAERARAAVWISPVSSAAGFPETHPLFAGFLPAVPEALSKALEGHDLVVVFGAPVFTFHVEGHCAVTANGTPIVQVIDDPTMAAVSLAGEVIISTMRPALSALIALIDPDPSRPAAKGRSAAQAPVARNPIPAEFLMHALSLALPEHAVVVEEAPSHRAAMQRYLPMRGAGSFYTMASGGLGYALPASVGIAMADRNRRTVCLVGDGSAMYCIQALWTAAQHDLPLTVIVVNNLGYGALRAFGRMMQARNLPGMDLPGIGFVEIARGLGCRAARIESASEVAEALKTALSSARPYLLDVMVDPAVAELYQAGD